MHKIFLWKITSKILWKLLPKFCDSFVITSRILKSITKYLSPMSLRRLLSLLMNFYSVHYYQLCYFTLLFLHKFVSVNPITSLLSQLNLVHAVLQNYYTPLLIWEGVTLRKKKKVTLDKTLIFFLTIILSKFLFWK